MSTVPINPQRAVYEAIGRDAADDEEIAGQHRAKLEARAFYRRDRILTLAGIALCDGLNHGRAIRPCDGCRTAVREVLQREQIQVSSMGELEPTFVDGEVIVP
jgi:hypothetical protein